VGSDLTFRRNAPGIITTTPLTTCHGRRSQNIWKRKQFIDLHLPSQRDLLYMQRFFPQQLQHSIVQGTNAMNIDKFLLELINFCIFGSSNLITLLLPQRSGKGCPRPVKQGHSGCVKGGRAFGRQSTQLELRNKSHGGIVHVQAQQPFRI